jgi:hypothetical protein
MDVEITTVLAYQEIGSLAKRLRHIKNKKQPVSKAKLAVKSSSRGR